MSGKKQEYADISDLLLERGANYPMTMGRYEGPHTKLLSPSDPAKAGDTVAVVSKKGKIRILMKVTSVCAKSIQGQIANVLGDEPQGLSWNTKAEILNEHVWSIHRN